MAVKHMFYATVSCIHFYTQSLNTKFIEYSNLQSFVLYCFGNVKYTLKYSISIIIKLSQSLAYGYSGHFKVAGQLPVIEEKEYKRCNVHVSNRKSNNRIFKVYVFR